jgi:TonB family protein
VPLEIVVDTSGSVVEARVARSGAAGPGADLFEQAALAAIRSFRFAPAEVAGRPVRVRMRWPVQFRLR